MTALDRNNMPSVIDLYAGVGGLGLGAARAGFDVRMAVELDKIAIATHAQNFPNCRHLHRDVATISGADLLAEAGLAPTQLSGLIGGPPCQGFSVMGKNDPNDPRNALFSHFFRLVSETRPLFFVAENVPGILSEKNQGVLNAAFDLLPQSYQIHKIVIKASDIGAPTIRTRVFFVGMDAERMETNFAFDGLTPISGLHATVGHALQGLPAIRSNWGAEHQSWRKCGDVPQDGFFDRICNSIPYGIGDPHALKRYANAREISGCFGTVHDPETVKRFAKLQPGDTDIVSRAKKLDPLGFCPTLRAGTASDRGSFQAVRPIHPGSPRVITPREAARLQGFPDWFVFHPTKWHSFRQIGNSVSPIVSEALLSQIRLLLPAA